MKKKEKLKTNREISTETLHFESIASELFTNTSNRLSEIITLSDGNRTPRSGWNAGDVMTESKMQGRPPYDEIRRDGSWIYFNTI